VTEPAAGNGAALLELSEAEARLQAAADGLDDAACRAPSRLPGWSRGHLLTHLARNADGMGNLARWASTGEPTPMYASPEARAEAIEAGSARSAQELATDLANASARLGAWLASLTPAQRAAQVELGPSRTKTPASDLVLHRIREVDIHLVDLDVGAEPAGWSQDFALRTLDQLLPRFWSEGAMPVSRLAATDVERSWSVAAPDRAAGGELRGPAAALLGWLVGRVRVDQQAVAGLELASGGDVPSAPAWV
jgi:maleylpyruvate isomerase